jgi:hypothetical protein
MVEIEGHFSSAREIASAQEDIGYKINSYLRQRGWEHTSTTPGCYWMWKRTIDGVVYMVDTDAAVRIQGTFEETAEVAES